MIADILDADHDGILKVDVIEKVPLWAHSLGWDVFISDANSFPQPT
jgi:hypothetical protein